VAGLFEETTMADTLPPNYTVTRDGDAWIEKGPNGWWGRSTKHKEAVRGCWVAYYCVVERLEYEAAITHRLLVLEKARAKAELAKWTKRGRKARGRK
jgi:hypothetical protein